MRNSKHVLSSFISATLLVGGLGLVQPLPSQAEVEFGGFKKILKKFFPPCGPGTKKERFVVKGEKVCDNKTGLWWQQTPGVPEVPGNPCTNTQQCNWFEGTAYCAALNENGAGKKSSGSCRRLKSY